MAVSVCNKITVLFLSLHSSLFALIVLFTCCFSSSRFREMGNCGGGMTPDERQARQKSSDIDKQIKKDERVYSNTIKILLLGKCWGVYLNDCAAVVECDLDWGLTNGIQLSAKV